MPKLWDWLVDKLVWDGVKKWARTPYLFDTEPNWELIGICLQKRLEHLQAQQEILQRMLLITKKITKKLRGV